MKTVKPRGHLAKCIRFKLPLTSKQFDQLADLVGESEALRVTQTPLDARRARRLEQAHEAGFDTWEEYLEATK